MIEGKGDPSAFFLVARSILLPVALVFSFFSVVITGLTVLRTVTIF